MRALGKSWMRGCLAALRPTPHGVLIGILLLLGLYLRVHAFAEPPPFMFDENHFVGGARQYLSGTPDFNDHPPLGKLMMTVPMRLLGDTPLGWRLTALFFGVLTIVLGGIGCGRLFKNSLAGWTAAAFLSADGILIGYSRIALLDIFLAAAGAAGILVASFRPRIATAIVAGLTAGFAMSVKFSGLAMLFVFAVAFYASDESRRKKIQLMLVCTATAGTVYFSQFMAGLYITSMPCSPLEVVKTTLRLIHGHSVFVDWTHYWVSGWTSWIVPTRTILLSRQVGMTGVKIVSGLGNLALYWPGILLSWTLIGVFVIKGVLPVIRAKVGTDVASSSISVTQFVMSNSRAVLIVLTGAIAYTAPWVLTHRASYFYHFVPIYAFVLILTGAYGGYVGKRRPMLFLVYLGVVLATAAFYAPVWSFMNVSEAAANARLFLSGWR